MPKLAVCLRRICSMQEAEEEPPVYDPEDDEIRFVDEDEEGDE
jgi:hypothetical protein